MYIGLMEELGVDFWCLAPDNPGFGQSDPLPVNELRAEGGQMAGYAAAIHESLVLLGIEDCYLFGHHTGAAIAVQLAVNFPGFVAKLALSGPPLLSAEQINYLKATLPILKPDEDGRFLIDLWQGLRRKGRQSALELTLRETISALDGRASYRLAYQAVFEQDFAGQLQAITCPVLLMAGEHDSLVASLRPAASLVKNGRFHIIPGAGTYICDEQPQLVAQLLKDFFN
jgi:pimeloyl-ACP methyl ester carboxylesterase